MYRSVDSKTGNLFMKPENLPNKRDLKLLPSLIKTYAFVESVMNDSAPVITTTLFNGALIK